MRFSGVVQLLMLCASGCQSNAPPPAPKSVQVQPMTIVLTTLNDEDMAVEVVITNNTENDIKIDGRLSALFVWEVTDGNGQPVSSKESTEQAQEKAEWIRIRPWASFTKTFNLKTDGIVDVAYARSMSASPEGALRVVPIAGLRRLRFERPAAGTEIRISLRYDGSDADQLDAIAIIYKTRAEAEGVFRGTAISNVCVVK